MLEGSVNFYKCSGLVSTYVDEITNFTGDYQFYINNMGYEELQEIAVLCIKSMETKNSAWNFLANGKFTLKQIIHQLYT